jgi:FtsH-binding integral membrane protein
MYSITRKDRPCAGRLFLGWGAFGLAMAAIWSVAHGNPVADAAIWALGLAAAAALLLGTRVL